MYGTGREFGTGGVIGRLVHHPHFLYAYMRLSAHSIFLFFGGYYYAKM